MPAMPIAESADRRRDQRDQQADQRGLGDGRTREQAERTQRRDDDHEDQRQPGKQDVEGDLVRRLTPLGALHQRDHAVQERLSWLLGDLHDDPVREHAGAAGDGAAVAAGFADDRR
jgi:hypothetical protein